MDYIKFINTEKMFVPDFFEHSTLPPLRADMKMIPIGRYQVNNWVPDLTKVPPVAFESGDYALECEMSYGEEKICGYRVYMQVTHMPSIG